MLFEYVQKAVEKARYKQLDDGTWYAEIPGFAGVWANGKTVEACRRELWEVLEEWVVLKLRDRESLPKVRGATVRIKEVRVA
jgi:predicted RNase H-like HicB family nuclease